jgi:hypothetical protein
VTGIEAREHLVASANATFEAYDVDQARYRFIRGDAFDALQQAHFRADTVLLLGFFYHVNRHVQLASLLAGTGAKDIVLDTLIVPDSNAADGSAIIELMIEPTDSEGNAFEPDPMAIVGRPSRAAIRLIFGHFGYGCREVDWSPFVCNDEALADYYRGERATFVLSRDSASANC